MANNKLFNCDHCKHQRKAFHEDKRHKEGGYWLYSCALNGDPFDAHAQFMDIQMNTVAI